MLLPEKVYKFRKWSDPYHQRLLKYNEVYLSSPRKFEDKFDCKIPQDFESLTNEDKKEIVKKLEAKWSKKITDSNKLFNDLSNQQNDQKSILNFSRDEYYGVVSLCTN